MLTFEEAQTRVLGLAKLLGTERVTVEAALGRVLAEELLAAADVPLFDASTMDGYAVRAADVGDGAMVVESESRAGAGASEPLAPGAACRIFTGAPLPMNADAVIMQEEAERDGDRVRFRVRPEAGAFIRRRGEDLKSGAVAIEKGSRVGASQIAMLASLDRRDALVARAPRLVVMATGDELRAPGTTGSDASIPESNAPAIAAMAKRAGANVTIAPPAPDDLARVTRAFEDALGTCDVLVTIGGVSVGDHDVVRAALEACGVSLDFWRVAIKPGKPLAVGTRGHTIVLGLPGNPVSAMVTFALFGVPLVRALQGDRRPLPRRRRARLAAPVRRKPGRLEMARARTEESGAISLLPNQASAAIIGLCRADVLACIPSDAESLDAGTEVDVYALEELGL